MSNRIPSKLHHRHLAPDPAFGGHDANSKGRRFVGGFSMCLSRVVVFDGILVMIRFEGAYNFDVI